MTLETAIGQKNSKDCLSLLFEGPENLHLNYKAAQAAAVPHEIKSRKKSKEKSLPLSHSIGVTSMNAH